MNSPTPAIQIENLAYAYGRAEAVHNLSLTVQPGRCYGLFGRNGAGKTTTMKCLLNLLRPQRGRVRVFGLDPAKAEVAVKRRLAYVPDQVAFYPWMTVRETLDYLASFRDHWNRKTEQELIERFRLNPAQRTDALSKGQRTQVALIAAICPETELLVLDEPTSGLDPIVRREFIETVIGAYKEYPAASAPDLGDQIMREVTQFCRGDFADDATLLTVVNLPARPFMFSH
jgi:ABC-type multidrug transport system ATPase subunit